MQDKINNLTSEQQKKYLKIIDVVGKGDTWLLDYLLSLDDKIDETITKIESKVEELKNTVSPNLNNILEQIKGKDGYSPKKGVDYEDGYTPIKGVDYEDGHDYVLSEIDKKEIASKIKVPVVEKIIERTEVIREQPIIKETINNTTIENPVTGEDIVSKINNQETKIKRDKIEGLASLEERIIAVGHSRGGGGPTGKVIAGNNIAVNYQGTDVVVSAIHSQLYWYKDQYPGVGLTGNVNGINADFSIPYASIECAWVEINGITQHDPQDYQAITFGGGIIFRFVLAPLASDKIFITYCTTVVPF